MWARYACAPHGKAEQHITCARIPHTHAHIASHKSPRTRTPHTHAHITSPTHTSHARTPHTRTHIPISARYRVFALAWPVERRRRCPGRQLHDGVAPPGGGGVTLGGRHVRVDAVRRVGPSGGVRGGVAMGVARDVSDGGRRWWRRDARRVDVEHRKRRAVRMRVQGAGWTCAGGKEPGHER